MSWLPKHKLQLLTPFRYTTEALTLFSRITAANLIQSETRFPSNPFSIHTPLANCTQGLLYVNWWSNFLISSGTSKMRFLFCKGRILMPFPGCASATSRKTLKTYHYIQLLYRLYYLQRIISDLFIFPRIVPFPFILLHSAPLRLPPFSLHSE